MNAIHKYFARARTHTHTHARARARKISVTTLETNLVPVDLKRNECENHLDRIDM